MPWRIIKVSARVYIIYVTYTPTEHNAPDNIQREIVTLRVEYSTARRFCRDMEVHSSPRDILRECRGVKNEAISLRIL
ncbi:hypothetical protein PUN28_003229 [Cardiocondyla obscurior]|uniref:Transposase n=1 Tax=Cardiocondyla obscurior TaxID=286306 RepID=A0AAW2GMY2_9HYME